jgi:hypothetical protein
MDAVGKGHENVWSCCSRKNVPPVDLQNNTVGWLLAKNSCAPWRQVSVQTPIGYRQPAGSCSSQGINT